VPSPRMEAHLYNAIPVLDHGFVARHRTIWGNDESDLFRRPASDYGRWHEIGPNGRRPDPLT